ncbi:MAG TPA: hypothetical protein VE863_11405 [Pyrinomonadaceae bacterium]|jgi:hypothetical protein|nr:hypothetical protein [Pyrinomonadaceae bacterium]
MKKLKSKIVTLAVLVALTGAFAPMQIVRADDTGGQGTSDSQKKGTTSSSSQAEAAALLALILRLLGW